MNNEDRINDTDTNNEVQGNDSEIKTDIQENGDNGREEVEIVTEEKEETKEDNTTSSLEQMKKVLMSYIDKIVDEKVNVVRETEIKKEIEEIEEPEEETLFNSFKDL